MAGSEIDARDPDGLERQIEATRAELARTIDSIADRVAPKNVARRSAEKVKEQAGHVVETVTGALTGVVRGESRRVDPESGIADDIMSTDYRRLPVSRGVLIGGAATAVAITAIVIWRRRRR
ncbi:MAG TPA: DUF3618 domain-containing protein [Streptosporangiaceae bacterium]